MKHILTKSNFQLITVLFLLVYSLQSRANVHFTESFTSPNFSVSSFYTGSFTLSSGVWDAKNVMGLETINAYNGTGQGIKLERYLDAYITTPALNTVGTVSFYYRNFSSLLGGGKFLVQKSVNNAAFTTISTITFSSTSEYALYSVNINEASSNVKIRIFCSAANSNTGYLCIDEFVVTDMNQTLAANPSALTGINYYIGAGPSTSQSFNLMGSNLTGFPGSIAIAAPTNYEVSINNTSFSSAVNVPYTAATLSAPVYVRLKSGLALGNYNSELVNISGGGAPSFTVACSGSVTNPPPATINVSPTSLSGFTYVFGAGPSVAQSYNMSATNLTGYPDSILVTAPADYQLSLDYSTYSSTLKIPYTASTLSSVVVYVRLKSGLAVNSYNSEIISNVGGGATTNVTCNGSVSAPPSAVISASTSTLSGFSYVSGSGPSTAQSFNLSGANLTGYTSNITVTATSNYEVCLTNNGTFTPSVLVAYTSATLASTPIYVRLKAGLAVGTYNGAVLQITGGGDADGTSLTCSGSVVVTPTITVSVTALDFEKVYTGYHSLPKKYTVTGSNLTQNITITAPTGIEITTTCGTGYTNSVSLVPASGSVSGTIYARYTGGVVSGNITHTHTGATTKNISVSEAATATNLPSTYYSTATGTGATLKTSLYNIIKTHTSVSYENLWTAYATTDLKPNGKIWDMYSDGDGCATPTYEFTYDTGQCGSYVNEGDCYNREHSFPKSWFNDATPMYTDLFHIVPTDGKVNGMRSNYPFGVVTSPTYTSTSNGSKLGPNTYGGTYTGLAFEPNDAYKGDFARNYLYMATCYETIISGWESTDVSGDAMLDGLSYPCFEPWALQMLLEWNAADPVDQKEKSRNDAVYTVQGNRNPFIDNPSYVNQIWGTTPALSVTPSALTGFTYSVGNGPSTAQTFVLSGANLTGFTANITISAPANFEVSTDGTSFAASKTVAYTSATLSNTTIYVRLATGLSANSYSGNITISGGGDTDGALVSVSGSVTAISATLTATPSTLSGFGYVVGAGPSTEQSFSLTGANLTGYTSNITLVAPTNFELSLTSGGTFSGTISVPYTSATLATTSIFVRLASGLTTGAYTGNITISGGGDADGTSVSLSANVTANSTSGCLSENFSGFTTGTHAVPGTTDVASSVNTYTQTTGWAGVKIFPAGGEIKLGSSSAAGSITTPTVNLVTGASVSFDIQLYGTDAGVVQVFHAPDGVTFSQVGTDITPTSLYSTKTVLISDGTSLSKIRIGTSQKRVYLDNISVDCGSTTPTPTLSVIPTSLTGFTYVASAGPSAQQSYTVSGTNLNGSNVTITPSTNYEISQTSGTGFVSTPIVLTAFSGTSTTIYVRLKSGLAVGTYNSEIITNAGGGATTVNVTCSGNVTSAPTPIITVNPTSLTGFTYVAGAGPSAQQSYTVSGTNLNGSNVTITPSTNYEISQTSGTGFGSTPIVLTAFSGTSTTIYVRLKSGLAVGTYNSEIITNAGGGATTVNVTCSGNVTDDVSVEEQTSGNWANVFPNPFSETLTIQLLENTNQSYTIQDALGRIVFSGTSDKASKHVLNTESLAPGLYILKVTSEGSEKVAKLVKR